MQRRDFLKVTGLTVGALCLNPTAALFGSMADGPKEPAPFSFVLMGDTHFAREKYYDPATIPQYAKSMSAQTADAWDALWDEIEGQLREGDPRPSFVLHLGDYLHGDCPTPAQSQGLYEDFVETMTKRNLSVPLMLTRGNHELQGKGVRPAYDANMPAFLKKAAPPSRGNAYYSFDAGSEAHFVVLDAYGAGGGSRLDADQTKWLEADLTAFRQRSPNGLLLVAAHCPHFPVSPRGALFDANPEGHADLTARLVKYRVNGILCGHLHVYSYLTYTDPQTKHAIPQLMTYAITPKKETPARAFQKPGYTPDIINQVDYRKPADLEAMRKIVAGLSPNVSDFRIATVPGYHVVTVDPAGDVKITSYRGLGRKVYETLVWARA